MSDLRFCDSGGLLVYARGRLSSDPSDYHLDVLQAPSGCNRMRCRQCQAMVSSDLPGGDVRLYACRCSTWESRSDAEAIDRDHESPNEPQVDWWCAAHPLPELPVRLDGFEVSGATDWAALVERVLAGECPRRLAPSGERPEGPSLWLGWLYAYLHGLPAAERMSAALAARLDDRDELVRGRVRHFFARFPLAAGSDEVLAAAAANPVELIVGYSIPEHYAEPTLFDVVVARLEAVRRRGASDASALEVLKQTMLAPPGSGGDVVEVALARFSSAFDDADLHLWIADHIVAIDQAAPGRWRPVMDLLSGWYQKPALGHLIVIAGTALLQRHAVAPADLRKWIDEAYARHRWVDDAWVMPLRTVADQVERRAP